MTADPPLTLAIEASNPGQHGPRPDPAARVSVCLGRTTRSGPPTLIACEQIKIAHRDDEALIPAIDRMVRAAGLTPRSIERVAVSIGPGGFTGLRVAVTFAKMVCEAVNAECIAVPTSRALIRRVEPGLRLQRQVAILLAWKRADVWIERYAPGDSFEPAREGSLEPIASLGLPENSAVVCDAPLEATLRAVGGFGDQTVFVRPRFDATAVLEAAWDIAPIDHLVLEPLYPREPEAATKWRELKKKSG